MNSKSKSKLTSALTFCMDTHMTLPLTVTLTVTFTLTLTFCIDTPHNFDIDFHFDRDLDFDFLYGHVVLRKSVYYKTIVLKVEFSDYTRIFLSYQSNLNQCQKFMFNAFLLIVQ